MSHPKIESSLPSGSLLLGDHSPDVNIQTDSSVVVGSNLKGPTLNMELSGAMNSAASIPLSHVNTVSVNSNPTQVAYFM